MEFKGKVALVTGASRGIGKAVAYELAKGGARVIVNYSRSESKAKEVVGAIERAGGSAVLCHFDVADSSTVQGAISGIGEKWGGVHILVNNAGITKDGLLLRMKDQDWDEVISVDLKGVFNSTKAALKVMMKQRYGRIVNITSVVGEMGNAGQSSYSAAKAGVIGFTKATAKEFASRGITVNAVSPGFIETDITDVLPEEVKERYLKSIPLGRFGAPEEVAKVVSFLASDDASYITGEVIRVNGGLYT